MTTHWARALFLWPVSTSLRVEDYVQSRIKSSRGQHSLWRPFYLASLQGFITIYCLLMLLLVFNDFFCITVACQTSVLKQNLTVWDAVGLHGKINAALVPKAHSLNTVQHYSLLPSFRALLLSFWIQLAISGARIGFSYENSSTTTDDQEWFHWYYKAAACNVQWSSTTFTHRRAGSLKSMGALTWVGSGSG